ncbi:MULTISPECIES: hypothetical protein [Rubinisphaera]|uniref:Uncharacterized protein n=1 Tax=Rubinisphaera italica TaxID=2527969 RepID=A0A5C5XPN8_9PLAN|nr:MULTISPECIES: hypothetical protein [Rubinisphaera]TWT63712.1 hypothetical protein Pan54_44700 [Rubinisphaera italica]TWT64009.1 hypothetical protein Pan54_47690 [Rubinisphaera italica]
MPRPDKGSPKSKTPPPNSDEIRQNISQLIGQLIAWDWIQQNSTQKGTKSKNQY